jgi:hypothetical protein
MLNVIRPSEEDLLPLVAEALTDAEPSDFIEQFTATAARLLNKNPRAYRSYGMYWYAIKALLIEHGYTEFGEAIEQGYATAYTYPSDTHTCCAAWAYRMHRIDNGLQYFSEHIAPTVEDQDYLYQLEDLEMESLVLG